MNSINDNELKWYNVMVPQVHIYDMWSTIACERSCVPIIRAWRADMVLSESIDSIREWIMVWIKKGNENVLN